MPFAQLTLNRPDMPQETRDLLAATVIDLLAQDLGKLARITVVHVDLVPTESWYVGPARPDGVGGHLTVSLSTGINTDTEKALFIRHMYDALARIVGPLADIFYIHVLEIPGSSWGYNGLPQSGRTEDVD
jgi:4-oxalocrotonate tautomerase